MGAMASQITSLTIDYSTVYSGADQRKHQSFASLAFVRGIHWWPVNSSHKWAVTQKMFPFDTVGFMRLIDSSIRLLCYYNLLIHYFFLLVTHKYLFLFTKELTVYISKPPEWHFIVILRDNKRG